MFSVLRSSNNFRPLIEMEMLHYHRILDLDPPLFLRNISLEYFLLARQHGWMCEVRHFRLLCFSLSIFIRYVVFSFCLGSVRCILVQCPSIARRQVSVKATSPLLLWFYYFFVCSFLVFSAQTQQMMRQRTWTIRNASEASIGFLRNILMSLLTLMINEYNS